MPDINTARPVGQAPKVTPVFETIHIQMRTQLSGAHEAMKRIESAVDRLLDPTPLPIPEGESGNVPSPTIQGKLNDDCRDFGLLVGRLTELAQRLERAA